MRRDVLLLEQMIEAADQAVALFEGVGIQDLAADRIRRDALLWNFTILGEASAQLSAEVTEQFTDVAWRQPARLRNRIVHGYWSIDLDTPHESNYLGSPQTSGACLPPLPELMGEALGQVGAPRLRRTQRQPPSSTVKSCLTREDGGTYGYRSAGHRMVTYPA